MPCGLVNTTQRPQTAAFDPSHVYARTAGGDYQAKRHPQAKRRPASRGNPRTDWSLDGEREQRHEGDFAVLDEELYDPPGAASAAAAMAQRVGQDPGWLDTASKVLEVVGKEIGRLERLPKYRGELGALTMGFTLEERVLSESDKTGPH